MKYPSFPFYVNDWLSAREIMIMSPAEEGAYIRLLALCWAGDGLPDDDDQLAVLSRLGKAWTKSKDRLRSCFIIKDDRLQHKRLLEEREKYVLFREKQRSNGQRGGRPKRIVNEVVEGEDSKGLGFPGFENEEPKKSFSFSLSPSPSIIERGGGESPQAQPLTSRVEQSNRALKARNVFQQPSETEVTLYFSERQAGKWNNERIAQESSRWYDHYLSNGWKVGKVPMKDWRAAVRKWIMNSFESKNVSVGNAESTNKELERQREQRQILEERTRRLAEG